MDILHGERMKCFTGTYHERTIMTEEAMAALPTAVTLMQVLRQLEIHRLDLRKNLAVLEWGQVCGREE